MKRYHLAIVAFGLILAGAGLLALFSRQTVVVNVDGVSLRVDTRALTVGGVLRDANLSLGSDDRVWPGVEARFWSAPLIRVERARPVIVADGDQPVTVSTSERLVANLLAQSRVRLFPGDRIFWNGVEVQAAQQLPAGPLGALQVRRAVSVALNEGQDHRVVASAGATLGQALWQAGIRMQPADRLTIPAGTRLDAPVEVELRRARPVQVSLAGQTVTLFTAAETVGEALREGGLALQGADYSVPADGDAIPASHTLRLVKVQEAVAVNQTLLPYETEYIADPETELDSESVIDPGAPGIVLQSERIRYEDGQEVSRQAQEEWTAQEPQTRQVGYGTKVVVRTMEVGGTTIEYWRAINVYATSYSPCRSAPDRCHYGTASGLKAQKGVAAVTVRWFLDMRGQNVYVPGYGSAVIGDTGGGIDGRYWIDLGYNDDDYVSWHQWVTVYFLTPVPSLIPYILYP